MPTFRIDKDGKFVHFEPSKAEELEVQLEDWLEQNDHVPLFPERLLYIGRQVRTDTNLAIDLLGVDSEQRPVVIELKKDRTPRDMVAQALEYTAFVRRLDFDALNGLAVAYFARNGQPWESLAEAHEEFYGEVADASWNSSQIVILVGQTIQPQISDVARYLRDHNIDVRLLQFVYLESSTGERLVDIQPVVGAEALPGKATQTAAQAAPSLDEVLASTPSLTNLFNALHDRFTDIGLHPRREKTILALDLSPGGDPLLSVWPSTSGKIFVLVLGRRAARMGELSQFQATVEGLNVFVRRGRTDLSVHLYPRDLEEVPRIAAAVKETFLDGGEGS